MATRRGRAAACRGGNSRQKTTCKAKTKPLIRKLASQVGHFQAALAACRGRCTALQARCTPARRAVIYELV
eukprot:scaffold4235_cov114-Isochrysis_galbana.AAC.3